MAKIKALKVGDKVYHNGDEVTVTSDVFQSLGTAWHNAVRDNGDVMMIRCPIAKAKEAEEKIALWQAQQESFKRLREIGKININN